MTRLYEVELTREQRASFYVLADNEDDLLQQLNDGLDDVLDEDDWVVSIFPSRTWTEVDSSLGQHVWSGGEDGEWVDPVGAL